MFDSKSSQKSEQTTDNRASQAGNDVNQTGVELTKSKNNTINISNTDYGAVQSAFGVVGGAIAGNVQVSESAMRNNRAVTQDVIGLVDATGRRNNDLTREMMGSSSAISEAALGVVDSSNRRSIDGMVSVVDKAFDFGGEAFDFADTAGRRANDTANNAMSKVAESVGQALGFADTTNRRATDALLLGQDRSFDFSRDVLNGTFEALDTKDRRQMDVTMRAMASSENSAALALSETRKATEQQVNAIKSFAENVTVGNVEGSNRLLLALIIGVVLVAISAVFFYFL